MDGNSTLTPSNYTSSISPEEEEDMWRSKFSTTGDFIAGSYLLLIGVTGLAMNVTILVSAVKADQVQSSVRYLLPLAVLDIGHALSFPMNITSLFRHGWRFGHTGCVAYGFVNFLCGLGKITSLMCIAIVRYVKICQNNRVIVTKNMLLAGVVAGVGYTLLWTLVPLVGFGQYGPEPNPVTCGLNWQVQDPANRAYTACILVMCAVVPLGVVTFAYGQVWRQNKKSAINNTRTPILLKTWACMSLSLLVEWGPYAVVSLVSLVGQSASIPDVLHFIPVICAKSSVVIDPLVYFYLIRCFRYLSYTRPDTHTSGTANPTRTTRQLQIFQARGPIVVNHM